MRCLRYAAPSLLLLVAHVRSAEPVGACRQSHSTCRQIQRGWCRSCLLQGFVPGRSIAVFTALNRHGTGGGGCAPLRQNRQTVALRQEFKQLLVSGDCRVMNVGAWRHAKASFVDGCRRRRGLFADKTMRLTGLRLSASPLQVSSARRLVAVGRGQAVALRETWSILTLIACAG
jgi:hypothetical protein